MNCVRGVSYTAVIRTLGTSEEKYQILLNSLAHQNIAPKAIIVYIARRLSPAQGDHREGALYLCEEGNGGTACSAL